MSRSEVDLPFYLWEMHHKRILEVGAVSQYRAWLADKLATGSHGICYGDTYIGKSAVTINFVQRHSGVSQRKAMQAVPVIYHHPWPAETYKFSLQQMAFDIFPWANNVGSICKRFNGSTAYWEKKLVELLLAASTRLIVIDEVSHYSQKVMENLLEFLTETVPHIGIIIIDYTPKFQWRMSREPLLTRWCDRFLFPKLELTEALQVCQQWEQEELGSNYLNWDSQWGQQVAAACEGHIGTLLQILNSAYQGFLFQKAETRVEIEQGISKEEERNTLMSWDEYEIQRKKVYEARGSVTFNGETDIPSLSKALLSKASETLARFREPVFAPHVSQELVAELDGNTEAAIIVHTIREMDLNVIISVPKEYQPNDEYALAEQLPPLLFDVENYINSLYYQETVAKLGITASSIASLMNWFIADKYTRDGRRCLDTVRAKKKLRKLESLGYIAVKPDSSPAAYISAEVFQAIVKRTRLDLDSTIGN